MQEGPPQFESVESTVQDLAKMNDLYYSRTFSKEMIDTLSKEEYLALCANIAQRRYEDGMKKQEDALDKIKKGEKVSKEAAFNQVVRNSDFIPRSLMETYITRELSQGEEGQRPIDELTKLVKQVVLKPTEEAKKAVIAKIIELYPEDILRAAIPFYNKYLGNEAEDNFTSVKDKSPEDALPRRKEDFCGQLIFMIESNVMARGQTTLEKTELAKAFNLIRKVEFTDENGKKIGAFAGLVKRLDDLRVGHTEDVSPPMSKETVEKIKVKGIEIQNKATLAEMKAEAEKVLETLRGVREQNQQKGQEFKMSNVIDMQAQQTIIDVCDKIQNGEINIDARTSEDYQTAVDAKIDMALLASLSKQFTHAMQNGDLETIERGMKSFRNVKLSDVISSAPDVVNEKGETHTAQNVYNEFKGKLSEKLSTAIASMNKDEVERISKFSKKFNLNLITNDQVKSTKTTQYSRSWATAFKDGIKALREMRFGDIFKKPERTMQEISELDANLNQNVKDLLKTTEEILSEPIVKKEDDTRLKIEALRTLGETKHFGEPTLAQKWIAVLYNKLDTDKSLNANQQNALIKAIEVLASNPDVQVKDSNWTYFVNPEIHEQLNKLGDEEHSVSDMLRKITFGQSPDLMEKLSSSTEESVQIDEGKDFAPALRLSVAHNLEKVQELSNQWTNDLTEYLREENLSTEEKEAVQGFRSGLLSIDKFKNLTELDKDLQRRIEEAKRDHDGVNPQVFEKLESVRQAIREGKAPEKDLFAKWIDKLEAFKEVREKNGGLKVEDLNAVDKVISMLEKPALKSDTNMFSMMLHKQINESISKDVRELLFEVNKGVKSGQEPKQESSRKMTM